METIAGTSKGRRLRAALVLILIFGAFLRFWGISSVYQRVDDIPVARHIESMYHGDWRPDPIYYYPVLFNYLVAGALRGLSAVVCGLGLNKGAEGSVFSFDQILFIARFFSALLGSLTVLVLYGLAKRLYGEKGALIATALFAVSFIHILYSHQIVLDVPMTFFYALALYFCALLLEQRKTRDYVLAGFFGGLAVATKYNGVFVLAAIVLAHLLGAPAVRKKILRLFFDPKIYLAGFTALAGFFLGHPYALIHLRRFLGASRLLLKVVHETEWFLEPIKPKTGLEYVQYNKYFLALKNIWLAEGPIILLLLFLGGLAVLRRRDRKNAFVALSGLAYFLGALGFLGFSRFRDLPTFVLFSALLGMLGLELAGGLFRHPGIRRRLFSPALVLIFLWLSFSALAKTYYLWEDDTTEMAERWIRRNIPPDKSFGKEWFSPPLRGRDYSYSSFSRPYLFSRQFAPYERFDFLLLSSAAYGHFFKNEKFYPEIVRIYREAREKYTKVKDFFFRDIEYKNPELNLLSTASPNQKKQRLSFPTTFPLRNPHREFEIADGSPYGKSVMNFFLGPRQKIERRIVSRRPVRTVAVFAQAAEGRGEIAVGNFLQRKKLPVTEKPSVLLLRPRRAFPFDRYFYRISVKSPRSLASAFIKICYEEFDIGQEFFRRGDYAAAERHFLAALAGRPQGGLDFEVFLYLAACARNQGRDEDGQRYLDEAPAELLRRRYLNLFRTDMKEKEWGEALAKFSGLDFELLEQTMANVIDDRDFEIARGRVLKDGACYGQQAVFPSLEMAGPAIEVLSPEFQLYPQKYVLKLVFFDPFGVDHVGGEMEVVTKGPAGENKRIFPLRLEKESENGRSASILSFECRSIEEKIRVRLRVENGQSLAFDYLSIGPDIRDFFQQKYGLLEGLGSASSEDD